MRVSLHVLFNQGVISLESGNAIDDSPVYWCRQLLCADAVGRLEPRILLGTPLLFGIDYDKALADIYAAFAGAGHSDDVSAGGCEQQLKVSKCGPKTTPDDR